MPPPPQEPSASATSTTEPVDEEEPKAKKMTRKELKKLKKKVFQLVVCKLQFTTTFFAVRCTLSWVSMFYLCVALYCKCMCIA